MTAWETVVCVVAALLAIIGLLTVMASILGGRSDRQVRRMTGEIVTAGEPDCYHCPVARENARLRTAATRRTGQETKP